MKWLKKLFGIQTQLEAKKSKHEKLLIQATKAQRNGNLREAGRLLHEAELLESEIMKQVVADIAKEGKQIEREHTERLVKNSKDVS